MTPRFPLLWLTLALVLAVPGIARPEEDRDYSSALCEQAIVNGARRGGVPTEVLHAVALTETGRRHEGRVRPWPWAINREGEGFWFKTYDEALAFAKQSIADGRLSFDVGCVQVNYRWHGRAFPSVEQMFDPEYTATYAAQFLRTLYEERHNWSEAAGAYHSLTPDKAAIYRKRFDQMFASLGPEALPDVGTLVAQATPGVGQSTRQNRREAQRATMANRIASAGPPPEPIMGSVAAIPVRQTAGGLLVQGNPLLSPGKPLLTAPGGGLF